MKHLICFACVAALVSTAPAATMIVDGKGGAGKFATIEAALQSLNRNDGQPDVVQVTAASITEPGSLTLDSTSGNADELMIVGLRADEKPATIVFPDRVADYAVNITANSATRLRLKNLNLIPEFKESTGARDFAHGGIRIRVKSASAKGQPAGAPQIELEDIAVTASLKGNVAADPTKRMGNYEAHTRWSGPASTAASALYFVEGNAAAAVNFVHCRAAHAGATGFLLRNGAELKVTLRNSGSSFGTQDGFLAQQSNGALSLEDCEANWNGGLGMMFASGAGRLQLNQCRFLCNAGRGLQVGIDGRETIPTRIDIRSGSFSENGWTDYNLSTARKYEYGILVWGGSPTVINIQGSAESPVLFLENFRRGFRVDNAQAKLERLEHAVFAGRHFESGVELVNLDLSTTPVISHCAFVANAYRSTYHSQLTISDDNSEAAAINISDCTFYNAAGKGAHHVAVEDFSDKPTRNLTLNFNRCIFAGGPAYKGTDERALYLDGIDCTARFENCALVTEGPYALNAKYVESNLAGHGNTIIETNSIHADPNFTPSRCTLRDAASYAAAGTFLRPQSAAYLASKTPGRVSLGGYSAEAGPAAPAVQPVRVAIYVDQGPDLVDIYQTARILQGCTDITFEEVKARDIWDGCLSRFDVIMFPGGSSAAEAHSLKAKGRGQIQDFLQKGGGYIGTCAGAYLLMPGQSYTGLNVLDAKSVDYQHWARGHGIVEIELTPMGKEILGNHYAENTIEYWQGPLMAPSGQTGGPGFTPLATYRTEIHDRGAPAGVMAGTTAIAAGQHGSGRYVAISCHPEGVITPTFRGDYVYNAIIWAASRKTPAP